MTHMDTISPKAKNLAGEIFKSFSVFTTTIIIAFTLVITTLFYHTYENEAEQRLKALTQNVALYLNNLSESDRIGLLEEQITEDIRYTLITNSGIVIYDNYQLNDTTENHSDRPEIKEALSFGESSIARYSKTLQTDTVYAAVMLDDSSVIRLAETRHSLINFLSYMIFPLTASIIVTIFASLVLSRLLTKRILRPIDALSFKEPLENDIYEEMKPLLERINDQQHLLKKQNEELALAESLRRDFSSNVSHEMKTPLQVISGYAELLMNDMVESGDRRKFSKLIYSEAQAMRALINDVLTLSRLDESAVDNSDQVIDLYTTAQTVSNRLEEFAASQRVTIHVEGSLSCLKGNATLAEEMIYNLVENGIRYNHPEGQVFVSTHADATGVIVTVRDTGSGIPQNQQEKVFERFFRIDKSRSKETGGTGLGLAIVKHAVLFHGGTIELESSLGSGTTFTLKFPTQSNKTSP